MRKDTIRLIFVAALGGFAMVSLSGCWQKTVKVDPAGETVKVADTAGVRTSDRPKVVSPEKAEPAKVVSVPVNEGAGAPEPLETPLSDRGAAPEMSGMPGATEMSGVGAVVVGSRTDLGLMPIYFDFDKSIVRPDQVERIEANALFLKGNPEIRVRIEGNCDGRGTNEYNMALGERRAMGAMKYLVNLGIPDSRLSILSYGEERPLNSGNDEVAWAENRRGDFVIVR